MHTPRSTQPRLPGGEALQAPRETRVRANGLEFGCFEWGAAHRGDGPTLLFVHATGFHARCWDPVIARLGARHMVALDLRGHGRSEKTPITGWKVFGEDLADFIRVLDLREMVGVGHSMGGHALVDAAAAEPGRFRRLVLIDPVIASPDDYASIPSPVGTGADRMRPVPHADGGWTIASTVGAQHPTARRRRYFESPAAMIERFRERAPYRVFTPEALEAYCTYGLLPLADGSGFELACPPEIEASIYMTSRTHGAVHESVRALDLPVLILRAKLPPDQRDVMDFSSSPTWPGLVGEFAHGREVHFAQHTHFLPMEIPDRIAALIVEELD
jgi:lipase